MKQMSLLLSLLLLAAACSGPAAGPDPVVQPDPEITFPSSEVVIAPEGETVSARVQANASWTVTADGQDWYTLASGNRIYAGESLLKVSAPENVTGTARSATLTFTSGSSKTSLKLSQGALVARLEFSPASGSVGGDGGEIVFQAVSNSSWALDEAALPWWLTPNFKTIGKGETELKVKVAKNYKAEARSGEIKYTCEGETRTLKVEQSAGTPVEDGAYVPEGYSLVWQDDFSVDGLPDAAEWWYETGAGGWGNNEIQEYVAGSKNGYDLASVSDGTLKIKAQKIGGKVYSIRMNTSQGWKYGYFEARIKVSDVPGAWPAFWMMPKNFTAWPKDGEIDIMEYAVSTQGKDKSSSSIHCNAFNWPAGTQKTHVQPVPGAASEFHVYAMEWTASWMKFYVDGELHLTFNNNGKGYDSWPFDQSFYLKLNLAWGGNMGGTTDENQLPAVYEVDYVRVYQK